MSNTDVDVKAVQAGDEELPVFYRQGFQNFMEEAQKKDPDNVHRWVHISTKNQHLKTMKGWVPLEDAEKLARLGLKGLIVANGRARWMDLELWTMPRSRADRIRRHLSEDVARRSASAREAMANTIAETTGRSKGAVRPFIDTGGEGSLSTNKKVERPE